MIAMEKASLWGFPDVGNYHVLVIITPLFTVSIIPLPMSLSGNIVYHVRNGQRKNRAGQLKPEGKRYSSEVLSDQTGFVAQNHSNVFFLEMEEHINGKKERHSLTV